MQTNPQMQAVIDELASITPTPFTSLPPEMARRGPKADAAVKQLLVDRGEDTTPQSVDRVESISIPGPGGAIDARLYAPASMTTLPVVVYWHGGGWVFADLDTYDATPRALADMAGCIVVSCHYRQAPEHPFPAPVEDAYAAYQWVRANAGTFGGDPSRVAVAGESAGGNLATVVSMMARDRGQPAPLFQLLVYPVTNPAFDTPSMREVPQDQLPLNRPGMEWFWGHYLQGNADAENPYASPLRASDLAGLPPARVVLAEIDPLRSEGEEYAERLHAAGVPVQVRIYEGVTHEFFGMVAVLDEALEAMAFAADGLRDAFGTAQPSMASVKAGMEVVTSDGEALGSIKQVRPGDFLVDRRMKRDVYVPLGSAKAVDGRVELLAGSSDLDRLSWTQPLPVSPM